VTVRVAEVQRALSILGLLPVGAAVDGVLDSDTREAIGSFLKTGEPVDLTPRIYEIIMAALKDVTYNE
jgi:hypothetical protein